jgi:aspartate/methionine/tyrosine aminotransferase
LKFASRATAISPFLAMAYGEKATELSEQGHQVVRLNLGEPDFGAPMPVLDAMKTSLDDASYPYTGALGLSALRNAISTFYKTKHNVTVPASRIVVTAGASGALLLASAALVENGDNVLLGDPSYPCNRRFLNAFGADVSLIPTTSESKFQLTNRLVMQHWKPTTKGVLIATPANPTGTAIDDQALRDIGETCKRNDAFLIVDEIYLDLALAKANDTGANTASTNLRTVLSHEGLHDNTIVINSFSKYFGMTGWRLGWCVVPEKMVAVMERLAQNLFICPSTLAQRAALACFSNDALQQCEQNRKTLSARAAHVFKSLSNMGLPVEAYPDGAFYAYINIKNTGLSAIEFCDQLLETHYVALTPGNDFGEANASHYVRLSFATSDAELSEGLERMAAFVRPLLQS